MDVSPESARNRFGRRLKLESAPKSLNELKERLNGLVVCLSKSWGGLEQVAANDALELKALGLDIRVLCLEESPIHQFLKQTSTSLLPISYRPRNVLDFRLRSEIQALLHQGVNLIHTHQPSLLGSLVPALWGQSKVALVATRHILNNHNKKDFFHRALYQRVDSLVVVSQALRKNVIATHAILERKVQVVQLGLDFTAFDPERVSPASQRSEWGAQPSTVVIGIVGRIDPAKGQGTFIKAAAALLRSARPEQDLKFVIIGEETRGTEGEYLQELKAMVEQFRLEGDFVFSGFKENIPEVMAALDICVMPSREEAFGLVAIEAMAMECPIIISKGGSSEEIVEGEKFGLLVRPEDAFDLQRQMRVLINQPEVREKMGRRARAHVLENYNRANRVNKMAKIYERALRRRRIL